MDQAQTHAFKLQLLAQRQELLAQLVQLRGGDVSRAEASADHFGQVEDSRAQTASARELEFALEEHESAALSMIDAALKRLEAGVYGECMDCGLSIALKRLQATPQALRCVSCQEIFERDGARSTY